MCRHVSLSSHGTYKMLYMRVLIRIYSEINQCTLTFFRIYCYCKTKSEMLTEGEKCWFELNKKFVELLYCLCSRRTSNNSFIFNSFSTPYQCGVHAIDQLLKKKEAHLNDDYALLKEYFIEFEDSCAVRTEIKSLLASGMSWK